MEMSRVVVCMFFWVGSSALAACSGSSSGGGGAGANEAPPFQTCGGDVVGSWNAVNEHEPPVTNPNVNACWNLQGDYASGTYGASSRYPNPERRETRLRFQQDGAYTFSQTLSGIVHTSYAPECLVSAQGKSPTCDELQTALRNSGIGEGSYFDTTCAARAGGGCDCSVRVEMVGGSQGTWKTEAGGITLTRDANLPAPHELTVAYCVNAAGLRFDAPIDGFIRNVSGSTFAREP